MFLIISDKLNGYSDFETSCESDELIIRTIKRCRKKHITYNMCYFFLFQHYLLSFRMVKSSSNRQDRGATVKHGRNQTVMFVLHNVNNHDGRIFVMTRCGQKTREK